MSHRSFYPILFAIFPALSLLAYNIDEIKPQVALRSIVICFLAAWLVYYIFSRLVKDNNKAALVTVLLIIFIFTYGQVYNVLKTIDLAGFVPGRHRLLLPVYIAVFILGLILILRMKTRPTNLNPTLNLIGLLLVIFPLGQMILYSVRSFSEENRSANSTEQAFNLHLPAGQLPPDIYYIVLDAYARDDSLREDYGFDNRPFLKELEDMGFFVARCSQSNYAQTRLSLTSSLNMAYLQDLSENFQPGNTSRVMLNDMIHHSTVRSILENLGYKSIAFETGFKGTQLEDADLYLSPYGDDSNPSTLSGGLNSFEEMLFRTTAGLALIDSKSLLPDTLKTGLNNPNRVHRDLILYNLEQLETLPGKMRPMFVFAHLVIPHPPYVFEQDGSFVDYDKPDRVGYPDQIVYLNHRLIPVLQQIIAKSPVPPIIIIQADHGAILSPPSRRMNILNAYYLPGVSGTELNPEISPVNSFRMIMNEYFGGDFKLFVNTAYFSVYSKPYDFTIIPNTRKNCQ